MRSIQDPPLPAPEPIRRCCAEPLAARALRTGIELGLFDELARGPRSLVQLQRRLRLAPDSLHDLLDALVGLQLLGREGDDAGAVYVGQRDATAFLGPRVPAAQQAWLRDTLETASAGWPRWAALLRGQTVAVHVDPADATLAAHTRRIAPELLAGPLAAALIIDGTAGRLACVLAHALPALRGLVLEPAASRADAQARIAAGGLAARLAAADVAARWPTAALVIAYRAGPAPLLLDDLATRARAAQATGARLCVVAHGVDPARRDAAVPLLTVLERRAGGEACGAENLAGIEAACLAAGYADVRWQAPADALSIVHASA